MSKNPDTWMPLYIGDYLRKTMHLTIDQHGAYLMLIMACWCEGGTLPDDDEHLAAICRVSLPRWRKLRPAMIRFFSVDDAGWHNNRVSKELAKADEITEQRRKAGTNGAANRWQTDSKPMANAIVDPSQNDRPSHLPSHSLPTGSKEPERESRAREAPGQEALSQSPDKFEIDEEEIAAAAEARANAGLPEVNLRAEAVKFMHADRVYPSHSAWIRWGVNARADLVPSPNGHDPTFVYKPDHPTGPPPPFDPDGDSP